MTTHLRVDVVKVDRDINRTTGHLGDIVGLGDPRHGHGGSIALVRDERDGILIRANINNWHADVQLGIIQEKDNPVKEVGQRLWEVSWSMTKFQVVFNIVVAHFGPPGCDRHVWICDE